GAILAGWSALGTHAAAQLAGLYSPTCIHGAPLYRASCPKGDCSLMPTSNEALKRWVDEVARLTGPQAIHWCDGSDAENQQLLTQMLASGDLLELNQQTHPRCYLHRSSPSDVARVEHLTFVCTNER